MASKRKTESQAPAEESDILQIRPLGAGQEVGRSCHLLEFKGKKILLDCGIHPGMSGMASLPYLDMIEPEEIDLMLVSHFHLDHAGGLPYFLQKTPFKGRCFMTHATKAIYRWLLSDYVKVSNIASDDQLYTDSDIEKSMEKIETINFHQEVNANGVRFWCYSAGHVLGAAMFMIEIAGVKILYTGDYSRQEDRHLMCAEMPSVKPDIVIIESTYGTHIHENREEREHRFTSLVHDIVNRGGRCLIPAFALGRAQELLLILDEYWSNHPELHDIPIYYASQLAKKCMSVYQTYINAMNEKIRRQITMSNPFVFKHIINLKNMEQFDDIGPSVVLASPGMMQSGLSRELFEGWCTDKRNGCIIAGYCVEGTLAKHVLSEPNEIVSLGGQKLPLKCSVDYISFSAHADYKQTSEFLRELKPAHVVLVHGEMNEMARLKAALMREYEDDPDYKMEVHNPRNTVSIELHFRGEKIAKVVGDLAADPPKQDHKVSGILVKRNFNYHIVSPKDLQSYTDLAMSTVSQKMSVVFTGPASLLAYFLTQLAGDIKYLSTEAASSRPTNSSVTVQVFGSVTITLSQGVAYIEWTANPVTDMYADAVIAVILRAEQQPIPAKAIPPPLKVDRAHFQECLLETLSNMFGPECTSKVFQRDRLTLNIDEKTAVINLDTLDVLCEDEPLKQVIHSVVARLHQAINPIKI
ncbi:hypothetical protein EGW08_015336 [Elysia chlorotica]|uniref:Cleavage and polyadenylation specificity factor subunit 3 n=1 Tax=Elysia chlorotica TaxID=188477 RepID=A0A3S1B5Y7_ELYCH|nr:hypothetical protein EGW08_015336 [Elysia chlorotica]